MCAKSVSLTWFLPQFDVCCDVLRNRPTTHTLLFRQSSLLKIWTDLTSLEDQIKLFQIKPWGSNQAISRKFFTIEDDPGDWALSDWLISTVHLFTWVNQIRNSLSQTTNLHIYRYWWLHQSKNTTTVHSDLKLWLGRTNHVSSRINNVVV